MHRHNIIYTSLPTEPCDPSISGKDKLLKDIEAATNEVRANWYSLAIELDIDYGTRKVRSV